MSNAPAILDHSQILTPLDILNRRTKRWDSYSYKLADGNQFGLDVAMMDDLGVDENEMSVWIPFADGNRRDGVGDLLEVGGIITSRHQGNPIILFDHGKQVQLPIALAEDRRTKAYTVVVDPMTRMAKANAFFYQGSGMSQVDKGQEYDHAIFCEQLFDLICKRYIRAGSIGYQVMKALNLPADYESGTPQGLHLLQVLMLEASAVVLPANGDTVRKMLAMPEVCGKKLSPYLVKSLAPYAGEKKVQMGYEGKKSLADEIARASGGTIKDSGYGYVDIVKDGRRIASIAEPNSVEGVSDRSLSEWLPKNGFRQVGSPADNSWERKALPYGDDEAKPAAAIRRKRGGTEWEVPVPHGDLSKTDVPPARWKPGVGAEKKLKELRGKYRKGFRRRVRKSSPGTAIIYVDTKDMSQAKELATSLGLKFEWTGTHGSGLTTTEKIRLTGDDNNIDVVARKYGRGAIKSMKRVKALETSTKGVRGKKPYRDVTWNDIFKKMSKEQIKDKFRNEPSLKKGDTEQVGNKISDFLAKLHELVITELLREYEEVGELNNLYDLADDLAYQLMMEVYPGDKSLIKRKSYGEFDYKDMGEQAYTFSVWIRSGEGWTRRVLTVMASNVQAGMAEAEKLAGPGFGGFVSPGVADPKKQKAVKAARRREQGKGIKGGVGSEDFEISLARRLVDKLHDLGDGRVGLNDWKAGTQPFTVLDEGNKFSVNGADGHNIGLFGTEASAQFFADAANAIRVSKGKKKKDLPLRSSKSMNQRNKAMPDAPPEATDEVLEPYGAQVLRRVREDFSLILEDYDEMIQLLEHEGVKNHVTSVLETVTSHLDEAESLFQENYPDLKLVMEGQDGEEGEVSDKDFDEIPEDVPDEEVEATTDEAGQELEDANKDMDTMDDAASPASSGDGDSDDVPPEDVAEGMGQKALPKKSIKTLRKTYAGDKALKAKKMYLKKGVDDENAEGWYIVATGLRDGPYETREDAERALRRFMAAPLGIPAEVVAILPKAKVRYEGKGLKAQDPYPGRCPKKNSNGGRCIMDEGHEGRCQYESGRTKVLCPDCGKEGCSCKSKRLRKDLTQEEAAQVGDVIESQTNDTESAPVEDSFTKALESHESSSVQEASGFLGEVAQAQDFGDEQRMQSFHYHKVLGKMCGKFLPALIGPVAGALAAGAAGAMSGGGNKGMPGEDDPQGDNLDEFDIGGEGLKSLHPHRKTAGQVSHFFKALSQEQNFGDPHRQQAAEYQKALDALSGTEGPTEPAEPETQEIPEPGDVGAKDELDGDPLEDSVEGDTPEIGEIGEKGTFLKKAFTEQQKQMAELNKHLASMISVL